MDLSPRGIREHLRLNRPIYARTSAYGHFGREPDADGGFSWERTDLVDAHRSALTPDVARASVPLMRRPVRPRRIVLRPAHGKVAPPGQRHALGERASDADLLDLAARRPVRSPRSFRCRSTRFAWRSASAAASISSPRPSALPDTGFIGVEPFENGLAKAVDGDRTRRESGTSGSSTRTRPSCSTGCRRIAGADRPALPRSVAEAAPLEAPLRERGEPRPHRPGAAAERRLPLRQRRARLRALDKSRSRPARQLPFCTGGSDEAVPYEDWPGTRYEAKAIAAGRAPRLSRFCQSGGAADERGALNSLDAPEAGNEMAFPDREAEDAEIRKSRIGRRIRMAREIGMAQRGIGIGRRRPTRVRRMVAICGPPASGAAVKRSEARASARDFACEPRDRTGGEAASRPRLGATATKEQKGAAIRAQSWRKRPARQPPASDLAASTVSGIFPCNRP